MALLLSFLQFVAETAPALVADIKALITAWGSKNSIPTETLLPALDGALASKVTEADAQASALIDDFWNKK